MNNVATLEYYGLQFYCPGCCEYHYVPINAEQANRHNTNTHWEWNGSLEKPTLNPSLLRKTGPFPEEFDPGPKYPLNAQRLHICHSFVREGRIEFLNDCTHKLAGQTVTLLLNESR